MTRVPHSQGPAPRSLLALDDPRLGLGDPDRVTLVICLLSLGIRLAYLPWLWAVGPRWLVLQTVLGIALYLFLSAIRRLPDRQDLIILAYGPEWLLWACSTAAVFGLDCAFQLYPLLTLPVFVLLCQHLEPRRRLALIGAPFILYAPLVVIYWRLTPLVPLAEATRHWLSMVNELVVAGIVVLVAGAALLEQIRARRTAEVREAAQAQLVEDPSPSPATSPRAATGHPRGETRKAGGLYWNGAAGSIERVTLVSNLVQAGAGTGVGAAGYAGGAYVGCADLIDHVTLSGNEVHGGESTENRGVMPSGEASGSTAPARRRSASRR